MSEMQDTLTSAVRSATSAWKKAKRQADKEDRVGKRDLGRLRSYRPPKITIRDAAFDVMEQAYLKASGNGRYYANARQIMYAARPFVLERTGGENLDSRYFTQTLLKDYLEIYTPGWRVVWDARGHVTEPHTQKNVGLGGIEVMEYTKDWTGVEFETFPTGMPETKIKTTGPTLRFGAVLFIEKEGFDPILKDAGLAEKYDIAIMSTKGLPVGAACKLASRFTTEGLKILVMHDFDLDGFKIVRTLRRGTRLAPGTPVIDIGFRFKDIEGLQSEQVVYKQKKNPKSYLRQCGANEKERNFLVSSSGYGYGWYGERVELNAMTSDQLITWLERKLFEHGISKLIPEEEKLRNAYQRAVFLQTIESEVEKIRERIEAQEITVPNDLKQLVTEMLQDDAELSWDAAVWKVALTDEN
ncbi:hypothetical protein H8E77_09875 [bacterium]|nr:hypothetical protein [bacterium]